MTQTPATLGATTPQTEPDFLPGWHVLLDLYGARHLTDAARLQEVLILAAKAAGARVLSAHVHAFDGKAGVTGVVLLAESHITVHTWPELGLAAVDIFMCGTADIEAAQRHIEAALQPSRSQITKVPRGRG